MSDFDWRAFLGKLAPTAATLLAGPFAGMAVTAIGDALGVSEPTQEKIATALKSGQLSGDQLVAVKLAEQNLALKLEEIGVQREALIVEDRQGARAMQIATRSPVPAILTLITTVGFLGILTLMIFKPDVKESAPLMIMLGQLSAGWAAALAFWFGTTSNSQSKTNLLAQSSPVK